MGCGLLFGAVGCKGSQPVVENDPGVSRPAPPSNQAPRSIDQVQRQRIDRDYVEATTRLIRADYQGALALFEEVAKADPTNHAALFNIARLSLELRQYDRAISYADRALKLKKDNIWYYKILQQAYEFRGDYDQAIRTQELLARQFPQNVPERLYLAELYLKNKQTEAALKELGDVEAMQGMNREIAVRKYKIFYDSDDFNGALEEARKLLKIVDDEPQFYEMEFEALIALKKNQEALRSLEKLLALNPESGFALLTMADYYKSQNQLKKSDEYLFKAFRVSDIDPDKKMKLIEQMLPFAETEPEVIPRIRSLAKIFGETHPGSSRATAIQGKMLFLDGQTDSAQVYFRRSLEQDPAQTGIWLDLIETSFAKGDFRQLNKDAEEALEFFPNQEKFLFFFGISSSYLDDVSAASYALEKILKLGSKDKDLLVETHTELGKINSQKNKGEAARYHFQKALELSPDNPYVLENYGDALYSLGEKDQAIEKWRTALKQGAKGWSVEDKLRQP